MGKSQASGFPLFPGFMLTLNLYFLEEHDLIKKKLKEPQFVLKMMFLTFTVPERVFKPLAPSVSCIALWLNKATVNYEISA